MKESLKTNQYILAELDLLYDKIKDEKLLRLMLDAQIRLADLYMNLNRYEEAKKSCETQLQIMDRIRSTAPAADFMKETRTCCFNIGKISEKQGCFTEAADAYEKAYQHCLWVDSCTAETLQALIRIYGRIGDVTNAQKYTDIYNRLEEYRKRILAQGGPKKVKHIFSVF